MANMKRKAILLLILPALMLLMACGGEDETGLDSMSTATLLRHKFLVF